MAARSSIKTQLLEQIYDSKSMLDETNFYNQRYGKPDELSTKITWLLGDNKKMFPIASMTEGNHVNYGGEDKSDTFKSKNNASRELDDMQYHYPVLSRTWKAATVADNLYSASDKPGIGNSLFTVPFTDNWLRRNQIIESANGVQARVMKEPEKNGDYWLYTLQLDPAEANTYCDLTQLRGGTLWGELNDASSESESTGSTFKRVAPGKMKNQMGVIRHSHSWAGNSAKKVMTYNIEVEGKSLSMWMDWELFLFERDWLMQKENSYWYSRYNRSTDGTVALKDLFTGKVIPRGSGILEQIPNYFQYSKLTYNKLQATVRDAFFGQSDTEGISITLMTGTGGMQEFHNAMVSAGNSQLLSLNAVIGDKFVTGTGRNLALGGYFDTFYHIDGYTIKVKKNAFFDYGPRAIKSPKHPQTGLPLESYRMVFLDDNDYDGEPNIQHVTQKGRSFIHGVQTGLTPMPKEYGFISGSGSNDMMLLSTDKDVSSYHRLSVCGVQIKRATKCVHLECTAGLGF